MSSEELIAIKKRLIAACVSQQEQIAQTSLGLMNEAQQMANEYGPPKDRYDAFRTKQMRQAEMYSHQYDTARQNIRTLQRIDPDKVTEEVGFGSLVFTDTQKMLISVSLGKIEMEGDTYYAVSVQVPVFQAMKGRKKGEEFLFNGKKHTIISIT